MLMALKNMGIYIVKYKSEKKMPLREATQWQGFPLKDQYQCF